MVNSNLSETIFVGDSEMARLMRSHDWSQTPLGSPSTWAQSLKTSVSILLNSRYPMFVWWGQEYANLYNDAYRPILGASKHPQFLGQSAKDCWADVWDVVGPLADSVLATGQPTWSENLLLIMERNGYAEEAYFTFSYSPVRDESGGVGGIFCAVIETTQQIIGERRLRTLRELSANTVEAKTVEEACHLATATLSANAHDIPFALLYLVEPDGNQARLASTTTHLEPGTIASPQQVNLTQATDFWNLCRVKQTGEAERVENLTTHFGEFPGGVWSESAHAALVMPLAQSGQAQQLAGFLVIGISPRRVLDDEYRGFFDLVSSHVTTAIANAQAYEAERKRAEALAELERAKTTFFSNISHEFRTPLTLMISPLEELSHTLDARLQPDEREQLQLVQQNSLRLQKLVNTLLDFSRIEAGRIQAVYEPIDLAAFTADLASVFRSAIEQAGLRLVVDCPPLPQQVYVDREMWEKIVLNLLSNAFKFTFEGEITVSLRSCKAHVELEVRDTGTGIPTDELPHIFERFHRVRGARGRSYEGSGIGLSLVQELVRLHGGAIEVNSTVDQGTCFTVSIPTGCAHLPSEAINATRRLTSTATGAMPYVEEILRWLPEENRRVDEWESGRGTENPSTHPPIHPSTHLPIYPSTSSPSAAKILLADDNADMRDYLKRLLSHQYDVEAVTNGVEALAAIRQQMPDLLLADVMMPKLDGFELLRALRTDPQTQELPIVLFSARAGEEARIEGLAAGADDYLTKPFSARELLARVEATLKLAQLRQEVGAALRESEAKYRLLFESIDQGFCIIEMVFNAANQPIDYRFLLTNPAFDKQTGTENAMGKTVREIAPQHEDYWFEIYGNVALTGESIRFENLAQEFHRWYEVYAFPIGEPEQRRVGILFNDITDRKRVEEARAATEQRYRIVSDLIPFGMWEADMQGSATYLSQLFLEMTGQTLEEHRQTWHTLLHPDDRQPTVAAWYECVQSGSLWEHEFRIRGKDGHYRTILARGLPVRNTAGEITSYVGANYDITDRKQAEEALRRSEERLRVS
jgi:PAS domain S-box-containing protein